MSGAALTLAAVLALAGRPECGGSQGVEPARLAAIAQAESGFRPLAINVNGGPQVAQPATAEEAARVATALITAGKSVDLGLMQINSTQLARHNLTVAAAFDACASMAAGAAHIAADLRAAWNAAHQRYNSGSLTGAPAYAQRIGAAMAQIAGTPPAPLPPAANPPAQPWDVWEREDDEQPRTVAPVPAPSPASPPATQAAPGQPGPVALQAVEIE